MSQTYRLYGEIVRSDIPLHAQNATSQPSITLTVGNAGTDEEERLLASTDWPGTGYKILATSTGHIVRFNSLFDFVVRDNAVTVVRTGDVDLEMAGVLFTGNVMSVLMTLAGRCVLHASGVSSAGHALAFVGPPGMGKSTLAALLCSAGAQFVSDDVLVVDERDGRFHCVPSGAEIRLRPSAASLADDLTGDARESVDGRTTIGIATPTESPTLRAIVFPRPVKDASDLDIKKVSNADALMELTRYPRLLGWQAQEILEQSFRWNARIARQIPCYSAVLPWGPPFEPVVARSLLDLTR